MLVIDQIYSEKIQNFMVNNNTISFYADKFIERYQFFTYVSEFYGKYGWTEPDNLEYIWPVK